MNEYKEGDVVTARITGVENYGAFAMIDLDYSGLIHISEITNDFVKDINDYVEIGDTVNVRILSIPSNHNQLTFSMKGCNNDLKKKNKRKLKETFFGFYLLKKALPTWIDEKMKEIEKKC